MILTNVNLVKLFVLHVCKEKTEAVFIKDIYIALKSNEIDGISADLLSKTLHGMEMDRTLEIKNDKVLITDLGRKMLKAGKDNLNAFVELLNNTQETNGNHEVPNLLDSVVAFKTIPYRISFLNSKDESEFFRSKVLNKEPYRFEGRGLGKSQLAIKNGDLPYSYLNYAVLFFNAGVIQYVGIIDMYDNQNKALYLCGVIRLKSPISLLDIRNNVRYNFNGSQQKQELYLTKEADAMLKLLKDNIKKYGCEVYV